MKTNVRRTTQPPIYTHEGAQAVRIDAEAELRRSVMACMLWESSFYESGVEIAKRIFDLVPLVGLEKTAAIAVEARERMHLRHAPLLLCVAMTKHFQGKLVGDTITRVIQRADELAEILALYWSVNTRKTTGAPKLPQNLQMLKAKPTRACPLSKQLKRGVAGAFAKFNEYHFGKYDRDGAVRLRDALFLTHPKPLGERESLYKAIAECTLAVPDTWETALSGGADKKTAFERLIAERKLGAMALLRNLRGMLEAGVGLDVLRGALAECQADRVLPFRFIAAARHAPKLEPELEATMFRCLSEHEKLAGRTCIVVDNSGSMADRISSRSEMTRFDAAGALAMLLREICEDLLVISFSTSAAIVPARHGFALRDAIHRATPIGCTNTDTALALAEHEGYDRIIVITDEQSHQTIRRPLAESKAYFINVAAYENGIGYGAWRHIDGWSESVVDYVLEVERGAR